MNTPPVISIIVAVYNGARTLQRCIDSVSRQTYPYKELILMDGGSTDQTVEILLANKNSINYWESEPDRGIYHAWNKALNHTSGDWVCFLGADDYLWEDNVLELMASQLAIIRANIRVAYGKVIEISRQGDITYIKGEPWEQAKKHMVVGLSIPHPGLMHRLELFRAHGKFDESFRIAGDYELLLRELKTNAAQFVPITVAAMERGGISTSMASWLAISNEAARARKQNGLPTFSFGAAWQFFKATVAYWLIRFFGDMAARRLGDIYRALTCRTPTWVKDHHHNSADASSSQPTQLKKKLKIENQDPSG